MLLKLTVLLFLTCSKVNLDFTVFDVKKPNNIQYPKWWKNGLFYQVYPKSFKNSNVDGIGDLNEITTKLDEMKEAGITGIWLSPSFGSERIDQGYNISDFENIDPEYGTMADFRKLVGDAHARDIKIIMDFVSNHFGILKNSESQLAEESHNWWNVLHGSTWDWINKRKRYYLDQFAEQEPDLGYQNPKLKEAMKDVLKIWIDNGVDGFRVDAVPFMLEEDQLRDELPLGYKGTIIFA